MGILAIVVVVLGAAIWYFVLRPREPKLVATVGLIPTIVKRLDATGHNEAFVVFRFTRPGEYVGEDTIAELQFSIEDSRLGLDWVLLAPRNIKDQDTIAQFIRAQGHTIAERQTNGIRYLRTVDGDLPALGVQIAQQVYGLRNDMVVDLIAEGFEWKI